MNCGELNLWGVCLLVVLTVGAGALFWVADRRTLRLVLRTGGLMLVQLLFVSGYVWGLMQLGRWWIDVLWLVLMALVTAQFVDYPSGKPHIVRLARRSAFLAILAGGGIMAGVLMICFHGHWFVPVVGLLMGQLSVTTTYLLKANDSSLRHTVEHRHFLLANGGTRIEVLLPTIRRALLASLVPLLKQWSSPLLVAMPVLFCGLLIGGMPVTMAFVVTLLMALATFVATVVTGVAALWLMNVLPT